MTVIRSKLIGHFIVLIKLYCDILGIKSSAIYHFSRWRSLTGSDCFLLFHAAALLFLEWNTMLGSWVQWSNHLKTATVDDVRHKPEPFHASTIWCVDWFRLQVYPWSPITWNMAVQKITVAIRKLMFSAISRVGNWIFLVRNILLEIHRRLSYWTHFI